MLRSSEAAPASPGPPPPHLPADLAKATHVPEQARREDSSPAHTPIQTASRPPSERTRPLSPASPRLTQPPKESQAQWRAARFLRRRLSLPNPAGWLSIFRGDTKPHPQRLQWSG